MNDRINLQNIAETIASQCNYPKKTIDAFLKSFLEVVTEGLMADDLVKVKGLGTFKVIEVDARESVSVTNGERITIPGFRKLNFIPEESVNSQFASVQLTEENQLEEIEDADSQEETSIAQPLEKDVDDVQHSDDEPNEFSGIDKLIFTPESMDNLKQELHTATEKNNEVQARLAQAEQKVAEALQAQETAEHALSASEDDVAKANNLLTEATQRRDEAVQRKQEAADALSLAQQALEEVQTEAEAAGAEVSRISSLIEGHDIVERYAAAAVETEDEIISEELPAVETMEPEAQEPTESSAEALATPVANEENEAYVDEEASQKKTLTILLVVLSIIIALGIALFCYLDHQDSALDVVPKPIPHSADTIAAKDSITDSIAEVAHADKSAEVTPEKKTEPEAKKEEVKPEEPKTPVKETKPQEKKAATPKTCVLQKGESLTRVSQRIYGTKDSVRAIIRKNNFSNPDNVPAGATILLP